MEKVAQQLTSNQNKGLIWKLLTDAGAFQNIPEHTMRADFEKTLKSMADQIQQTDKLVTLNKRLISEMMLAIAKQKETRANIVNDATLTNTNATLTNATNANANTYNSTDLLQQRQKAFQNELSNKKNEFDKLNAVKIPDKIDFSDTAIDSPIGSEMDKMLADQIALREKQLYNVLETQDKAAASKWLNNEGSASASASAIISTSASTSTSASISASNIKLKIGENIDLGATIKKEKKVNFREEPLHLLDESDNFMALLKRKDMNNNNTIKNNSEGDINSLLREILDKQNQILALLTKQN